MLSHSLCKYLNFTFQIRTPTGQSDRLRCALWSVAIALTRKMAMFLVESGTIWKCGLNSETSVLLQ